MKSIHLNLGVFFLTLTSSAVYLWRFGPETTNAYLTGAVLLCLLMLFLLKSGISNSFADKFPTFVFFWCALFVLLPANARPFEAYNASDMTRALNGIIGNWKVLLIALAVLLGLGMFMKKEGSIILAVCKYISLGVIIYTINAAVSEFRSVSITKGYLFIVPTVVGVYYLCKELNGEILKNKHSNLLKFFLISIIYEVAAAFVLNKTAFEKLFDIASLKYWILMAVIAFFCAGIALYEAACIHQQEKRVDVYGFTQQYQLIAMLGVLFIATKLLNRGYSPVILFSGISIANVAYNFYRAKQLAQLPTNHVFDFDWKGWAILLLGILALEHLAIEKTMTLYIAGSLAFAYIISVHIMIKQNNSHIILGLAGVSTIIIRYILLFDEIRVGAIIISLLIAAIWIVYCVFAKRITADTKGLYGNEYDWLKRIAKYVPAALFVISSTQYLLNLI